MYPLPNKYFICLLILSAIYEVYLNSLEDCDSSNVIIYLEDTKRIQLVKVKRTCFKWAK